LLVAFVLSRWSALRVAGRWYIMSSTLVFWTQPYPRISIDMKGSTSQNVYLLAGRLRSRHRSHRRQMLYL
jgi:hypothetical protein